MTVGSPRPEFPSDESIIESLFTKMNAKLAAGVILTFSAWLLSLLVM